MVPGHRVVIAALDALGRRKEAEAAAMRFLQFTPNATAAASFRQLHQNQDFAEKLIRACREAGLPDQSFSDRSGSEKISSDLFYRASLPIDRSRSIGRCAGDITRRRLSFLCRNARMCWNSHELVGEKPMQPRMSDAECRLFENFARCSDRYLEFGSGGSTCLAASLVRSSIIAIDSSKSWLDDVAGYCSDKRLPTQPSLIHVDIGPTGDWGYPTDPSTRDRWPSYHHKVWQDTAALHADLYLVDGRFRVACFMQTVLHAVSDPIILFHDFRCRKDYHVVREVAREVAAAEDLSAFVPIKGQVREHAERILREYEFERQ